MSAVHESMLSVYALAGQQSPTAGSAPDDPVPAQMGDPGNAIERLAVAVERLRDTMRERDEQQIAVDAAAAHMVEGIAALRVDSQKADELHARILSMLGSATGSGGIDTLNTLLQAWTNKPTDLLIIVKLSEQAEALATIVRTFSDLRRLLDYPDSPPDSGGA